MTDEIRKGDELMEGVPHQPGTDTRLVEVRHPEMDDITTVIHVPLDHDGSRIPVEFPEIKDAESGITVQTAARTYIDGWDPTERALVATRPVVPCPKCGAEQPLSGPELVCSACGTKSTVQLRTSGDNGRAADTAKG